MSSSVGSQSRETSLGIFETPGNKGYEISSGHFPFPSIHPEADKVYDGASAPRGPYAAPPAITSPADQASEPLLGRCAADCSSCGANVLPKVSPNERGESSRSTTPRSTRRSATPIASSAINFRPQRLQLIQWWHTHPERPFRSSGDDAARTTSTTRLPPDRVLSRTARRRTTLTVARSSKRARGNGSPRR